MAFTYLLVPGFKCLMNVFISFFEFVFVFTLHLAYDSHSHRENHAAKNTYNCFTSILVFCKLVEVIMFNIEKLLKDINKFCFVDRLGQFMVFEIFDIVQSFFRVPWKYTSVFSGVRMGSLMGCRTWRWHFLLRFN